MLHLLELLELQSVPPRVSVPTKMLLVLALILSISFLFLKHTRSKYKHFASPGLCLPVIGHSHKLFSVSKDLVNGTWDLYRKYSRDGMLYVQAFREPQVWVGDHQLLKTIFNHHDSSGRSSDTLKKTRFIQMTRKVSGDNIPGLVMSEGELWHQQRRFTLRTLKDFGFGRQGMERLIQEETQQFINFIKPDSDKPVDFTNKINLAIINALWKISVGERFEYDDPVLLNIVQRLSECFKIVSDPKAGLVRSFPWLNYIVPEKIFKRKLLFSTFHRVVDMMQEKILEHQETLDLNSPRDYTDMMLIEIEKTTDTSSSFYGQQGLDNLKVNLFDLFLAGSETTSTTLSWAILYMIRYPGVQEQVQQELDQVVGTDRLPSLADRPNLPYTEAVIMEIQRCGNIGPFGVQHKM